MSNGWIQPHDDDIEGVDILLDQTLDRLDLVGQEAEFLEAGGDTHLYLAAEGIDEFDKAAGLTFLDVLWQSRQIDLFFAAARQKDTRAEQEQMRASQHRSLFHTI